MVADVEKFKQKIDALTLKELRQALASGLSGDEYKYALRRYYEKLRKLYS